MNKNKNDRIGNLDALAADNERLRARIQDLETYIDGRRDQWEALAIRLQNERRTMADLKTAIRVRDARIAGFARKTARLERRAQQRRREIELLRERQAHPGPASAPRSGEAAQVILKAAYRKLAGMRAEQRRLQAEIEEKDSCIDRLCGKLSDVELERLATVGELRKQRQIIDHIETEIRGRLSKVAEDSRKPRTARATTASIIRLDNPRVRRRGGVSRPAADTVGRLTLLNETGKPTEYAIGMKAMTIGRGSHNAIRVRREFVSREHARLTTAGDHVLLEDLGSRNGVRVNDRRVTRRRLESGDIITIGRVRFRFTTAEMPVNHDHAS
ncbi:MAG: FHA domain-containing protein [Gammaproteobacteria bacterium]